MQVRQHVAFEEQVFLKMREAMSQQDLDRLGVKLLSAAGTASARSHRRAPKRKGDGDGKGKGKPERSAGQNGEES